MNRDTLRLGSGPDATIKGKNTMNRLAISALALTGLLQASACIIVADDDPAGGTLDVSWSVSPACPAGASAEIISRPTTGEDFSDIYNCSDLKGLADVPLGDYLVWVEIVDASNVVLAKSNSIAAGLTIEGDVALVDLPQFPVNTGTLGASWSLVDSSNGVLSCADVGSGGVDILATLAGTTEAVSDVWNCTDGSGVTGPLDVGQYKYVVEVLNTATPPLALDVSAEKTATIAHGNEHIDLGNFEFQF